MTTESKIHRWVAKPLPSDVEAALVRLSREDDVRHIAVMPDVHLAREVCVGVAVATENTLLPAAVGGDIGCGMAAAAFDASADVLSDARTAAGVLDGLYQRVPVARHARKEAPALPSDLADQPLSHPSLEIHRRREASLQLGTLGRGNHFLELQADHEGRLWAMVHSGSRGMGEAIRAAHIQHAARTPAGFMGLQADSDLGRAYLRDVDWGLRYAAANRARILEAVQALLHDQLGITPQGTKPIGCHHNFVQRETHGEDSWWVHRKGAISAQVDEPGIIPGSMGAASFHVEGRGHAAALCSSSHGAGRALSRGEARRRISLRAFKASMQGIWFDHRLTRRLLDEAPGAYKDIDAVMRAQRPLTRIVRTLRPVLVFKGA